MSNPEAEKSNADPFAGFESVGYLDGVVVEPPKAADDSVAGDGEGAGADGDDGAGTDSTAGADSADGDAEKAEGVHADDVGDDKVEEKPVEKPKQKKSAQERINELTHARREAERREAAALERIAALERGDKKQDLTPPREAAKEETRPTPDKYEYGELDGKYIADVVAFETKKAIAAAKAEEANARQTEAAAAKQREYQARAETILGAGREKYEDFDEKVQESPAIKEITKVMHDLILESDVGADIAYHLASNPKEAREIFGKADYQQAAYFGRLEARFTAPPKAEKQPDPKPATKAPDPVKQPRGAGGKFATAPDTEDFAAFEALASRQ